MSFQDIHLVNTRRIDIDSFKCQFVTSDLNFLESWLSNSQIRSAAKRNSTISENGKLLSLDLSSLSLCDIPIDLKFPSHLAILNLSHNLLDEIPKSVFEGMYQLIDLNLRKNRLRVLPPDLLDDCKELMKLDLSLNHLMSLPHEIFKNTTNLKHLNLDANQLHDLPSGIFESVQQLQSLSLASNLLENLPGSIKDLQLKRLNLINNRGLRSIAKKYTTSLHIKKIMKIL